MNESELRAIARPAGTLPDAPIHDLIAAQVDATPDRLAVSSSGASLTYRDLDRRSNQLAHTLRARGVGLDSRVGILLPHGIDTIVAVVGVLKTGAAYVPLDAEHPPARLRFTLGDAGVGVVVTSAGLAPLVGAERTALRLDADADLVATAAADRPSVPVTAGALAYVIYTSGSTGVAKGVAISHQALVNYVCWARSVYLDGAARDFALHTSLAFDLTVTSIFVPLTTGGAVVAYPARDDGPSIFDVLRDDRADVVKLTPSHLALVADRGVGSARLRTFIVGGENLDTTLARRVHEMFGGRVAIFNEYGPTEATVGCMIHRFDPQRDRRSAVPIGVPAANTRVYVLDAGLQSVPPDGVGEIYVAGIGLAQGYLGQPELTEELFVSDPFHPGERMYRTGDLARRLPESGLEFVGRTDDQVKIGGHRIDLNEIRRVLLQHLRVRDCVVRRLEGRGGRGLLVAYCAVRQGADREDLRAFARERLVQAAVPGVFVFFDALPLSANGKVDVSALPGLDVIRQGMATGEDPRTPTERTLAQIWRRLLRDDRIGVRSNFFGLGGDSLLTVELFGEIEQAFHVKLSASTLFRDPTIAALAATIENHRAEQTGSALVAIRPQGRRRPLFLVHGIGGEVLSYEPLARHLHPEQPVYGLQGHAAGHPTGAPLQIETMASGYLEAIRTVQASGPYSLGGYSAGGLIAFEIARQLSASGQDVALLAILDGNAPGAERETVRWTPLTVGRFVKNLVFWVRDDPDAARPAVLWARLFSRGRRVRPPRRRESNEVPRAGQRRRGVDVRDTLGVPDMPDATVPWLEAYSDAMRAYRPASYAGRLTLIRARTFGLREHMASDRGWGRLAHDVQVRVIVGDHTTILREPRVRRLAEALDTELGRWPSNA